jgi:AcrR family transcriptional regulator
VARPIDPHRRGDLLRAARTTFAERGFAGARVADIAAGAGVATGTVYRYFDSKEALAAALVDDLFTRLTAELRPILARPADTAPIAAPVRAALAFLAQERDLLRLLRPELGLNALALYPPARGPRQFREELAAQLAAMMERGQLRHYDPAVLAALLIGLIEWVAEACLIRGDGDLAEYEETVLGLLHRALLPDGVAA